MGSILYNPFPMRMFEADGDFASGALAYFYLARSTTPLIVYVDSPLTTAHAWPVVADAYGLLPPVYITKGVEYKVRIEDALGSLLYAADGISNPDEAALAAGGGITTDSTQIFQTGHFDWQPTTAPRSGWVRANGRTISDFGKFGTEAALANCEALFTFLWDNFTDNLCPVTGGRGANAGADWNDGKQIATLDMRGRAAVGIDTMGNTAGDVIQVHTTLTTTSGSPNATVASGAGLCRSMIVRSTRVPLGALIQQIIGTAVTLTQNASSTGTDATARFSMFTDAEVAGMPGGQTTHQQSAAELATHNHDGVSDTSGTANMAIDSGSFYVAGLNRPLVASTGSRWAIGPMATAGNSSAMNIQSPMRTGSWFLKK